MDRETELTPIYQCLNCEIVFRVFATVELGGVTHELCPNPGCYGPIELCELLPNDAINRYFMHVIAHSGIDYIRRMNLREISESQMGPWDPAYRLY